ncbi:MAG TPA: leucyl aminopeptidase [Longimicrobiaceae bacterium]
MKISVARTDVTAFETPLLAVMVLEGANDLVGPAARLDERLGGQMSRLIQRGDFRGKLCETAMVYPPAGAIGAERVLLVGAGKAAELDTERLRRAAATAVKQAARLRLANLASTLHHAELATSPIAAAEAGRAVAEGAVLGAYVFDELKSKKEEDNGEAPVHVQAFTVLEESADKIPAIEEGARVGATLARGENLARTLGNLPGNVVTPEYLAREAERIAGDYGMKVTILGPAELEKEGMHALLAVSRGSDAEPRLIVLEHRKGPPDGKPLVLLGKGLTFDAGGISIKPAAGMEEMKFDMCGGAAVLGAMQAIGELDLPANVVGVVPSSENLLSGSSMKPGDILRSHLGKTIEVVNTDAEGRLILADALSYLRRFEPAAVVDAATLTGACVIALGHHASGAMGNDEELLKEVEAAGERVGQRVWRLPMFEEYREQIKSDYADLKNSGGRPAGTITAAWFLREFVGDFPWVHLDIAGTAYGDGKLSYQVKGATGAPTRLFVEWVRARTP